MARPGAMSRAPCAPVPEASFLPLHLPLFVIIIIKLMGLKKKCCSDLWTQWEQEKLDELRE